MKKWFCDDRLKGMPGPNIFITYNNIMDTLITIGGSRKYPYSYHGRHLEILKGRGFHRLQF